MMIRIKNLSVSYDNNPVINNLTLNVNEGDWILITGPSGCGKSTLARTISGLIPHSIQAKVKGSIQVNGINTVESSLPDISQQVGMVFQNPGTQLFHLTVEEELAFGPRNLGLSEKEVQDRVSRVLTDVGIYNIRKKRPDKLSGGQKQLVAVAAVLTMEPRVLVLDEPTASLDVSSLRRLMEVLSGIKTQKGITIIMVEHRLHAVQYGVDKFYVMDEGQFVHQGPAIDILEDPVCRKTYGLRRPVEQKMASWEKLINKNGVMDQNVPPLLQLKNVSAGYDGREVIKGINLALYPGEFVSLVGENGAGKSTLAMVIAGLLKTRSGEFCYQGGIKPKSGLDVAILFQNPQEQLFTDSVDEEVAFAAHNFGLFDQQQHQTVLEEAGLERFRFRHPSILSLGQQLRTALAASVAIKPRIVILDEPTLGQDWGHLEKIMNYVKVLQQNGTTILLITHDYKLVHFYSQRVLLMENGGIKLQGYIDREVRQGGY
jgi:energy-coupling factor transport system ATP-binding protein